jgi:hypothetical protein
MYFKTRKFLLSLLPILAWVWLFFQHTGCANIQPPMGGAKDTLPPILVKATPDENTVLFKGNTLRFQFDEYIQLENLNENLVINPPAESYPIIDAKLRVLTVKLKDTLQPNTTYTFNFGNAIKDVNESNPFKDFSYSFSTGSYIDSLELTGTIIDAETGLPDSTLILLLHSNLDDSAVAKEKPRFVTRANGKGQFRFTHLPAGTFNVFALKDEGVKKYSSPQTAFAFYDKTLRTDSGANELIELRSFIGEKEEPEKPSAGSTKKKKEAEEDKKLKYSVSASAGQQDILGPIAFNFQRKIDTVDLSKVKLIDTLFQPITGWRFEIDSLEMNGKLFVNWIADTEYRLILEKGFARDTIGATTSKNDTIEFKTKAESEYGALKIKFSGIDASRNPVLQWIENNNVVLSVPLQGNTYTVKLFQPSQYNLRILYDANGNGIWDTGDYWKKIQPEYVIPVEQKFSIKPNWDNEFEVNL